MSNLFVAAIELATDAIDVTAAALASVWPLSAASRATRCMVRKGFTRCDQCAIAYSLSFSEEMDTRTAIDVACASRVTVTDLTEAPYGRVTVQVPSRVTAYELSLVARRMQRLANACSGHVDEIGPIRARRRAPLGLPMRHRAA